MLSARLRAPVARLIHQSTGICQFSSNSTTDLIINAVGLDRPGIVSDVTGVVIDKGGNIGESQAARLGSHFSLMMSVSLPSANLAYLKESLDGLEEMNAAIYETSHPDSAGSVVREAGYSGLFRLEGADHPGIVHKVTSSLVKHGLSIERLSTDHEIAPHGGVTLFRMTGVASAAAPLASGFDAEKIKVDLEELGDSLNCSVTMEDMDGSEDLYATTVTA